MILEEMKKPTEDMCLTDHQSSEEKSRSWRIHTSMNTSVTGGASRYPGLLPSVWATRTPTTLSYSLF